MIFYCSADRFSRKGFSLVEAMLATMILGLLAIYVFTIISESNRGTTNAYYQYLAEQVACEPLEVFRFLGCNAILENQNQGIVDYKFNEWQKVAAVSEITGIERPEEATRFERRITATPIEKGGIKAVMVEVNIRSSLSGNPLGVGPGQQLSRSTIIVNQ
ncbi:MAG: prepilin-type N-terminal cleavage/methylation domain-containing protein [Candidatus Riflebacteria bacterium]|nr:prepilin-type N-terminal cleavage/methylation domain-containing protein [Candidatus Riflebacteria bacterium]